MQRVSFFLVFRMCLLIFGSGVWDWGLRFLGSGDWVGTGDFGTWDWGLVHTVGIGDRLRYNYTLHYIESKKLWIMSRLHISSYFFTDYHFFSGL